MTLEAGERRGGGSARSDVSSVRTGGQLDDYTFEEDPCAPVSGTCTGGARYAYVISASDITRPRPEGTKV